MQPYTPTLPLNGVPLQWRTRSFVHNSIGSAVQSAIDTTRGNLQALGSGIGSSLSSIQDKAEDLGGSISAGAQSIVGQAQDASEQLIGNVVGGLQQVPLVGGIFGGGGGISGFFGSLTGRILIGVAGVALILAIARPKK